MTGTRDREAEKAAREAAWWRGWWAEDFSWEGLRKRRWDDAPLRRWIGWSVTPDGQCVETRSAPDGSRPASLQDYFRWEPDAKRLRSDAELTDAGLLILRSGQPDFHILHLPQAYEDGTATFKAEPDTGTWAELETEIDRLLSRSGQTDKAINDDHTLTDHRAQLRGAILRRLPHAPASKKYAHLHLTADLSAFLAHFDASGLGFGSPADFAVTLFCSGASFIGTEFYGGDTNFNRAQFSGGDAHFGNAVFSGGSVDFGSAKFSGGDIHFDGAEFSSGYANFNNAEFSGGDTSFYKAKFCGGRASFANAEFSGGHAVFESAEFSDGAANFCFTKFSSGDANFDSAEFSEDASFFGTEFSDGDASFLDTTFAAGASFRGARFLKACEFGRSDQPYATQPQPGAQFLGPLNFRGAYFKGQTDFSRVRFPDKAEDRNSALEGARIFKPLDLKGVEHLPFSAFHGIRLDQGLLLDSQHPVPEQFDRAVEDAEAAISRDTDPGTAKPDPERCGADKRYAALEGGCRALKEAMARDGDRKREQEFFSHELAARAMRLRHRLTELKADTEGASARNKIGPARAELIASQLYKNLSGYGGSILRPLAALGLFSVGSVLALKDLVLGFALLGLLTGDASPLAGVCFGMECGPTLHPVVTDTLDAVVRGMLGPFRLLAGPGQPFAYLGDTAPVFRSLVGTIMLVHGLVSSALIFLWLLALRRQFQIN